ncbi:hypothetical protein PHYBLDRAFT_142883 [Phycomyces blakesleeanus NRRL 1555(-)]|uniref:Uncharacterized protein n=1 Tax=Phycomyces blakesleeanus (strain ATCC 8743b / DSM 1359 / FGSC 10004 / NBRC 33097 / NRRL 1555) TaxID=763407 RepID=A0A167NHB6_PHYB8|nr:hypothetical protein PHYBLDRAFT_142883 [Phycomyces blakesleeanus NRRL 1555(-)]OAD75900.1 hypothetical protein PHYBLDRAFT_142883 [Phycomyces blakesleeanus NRRL 1555(-)]|eukprot:XP_018293940.1 hypothetical protein PHYBLDRAFT_142883 [Phycomyces blakesleeanus NRRL 1555(-)]
MPTMNDRSFSIITGRLNPPYLARQDAFQVDEHENVVCVAPIERPRRKKMPVRVAMLGLCLYLFLVWDLCKCVGMKKLPGELFPPNQRGERVEYLWIPDLLVKDYDMDSLEFDSVDWVAWHCRLCLGMYKRMVAPKINGKNK